MLDGGAAGIGSEDDGYAGFRGAHDAIEARLVANGLLAFEDLPLGNAEGFGDVGLGLHDQGREGGDDRDFLVEEDLDGFVAHRAAMFDAIDAEFGDAANAGVVGGVSGDGEAIAMGFVDDGFEFGIGEFERVVAGHDLDQIRAALDLVAYRPAHFIGARGLAADPIGVAAGLDDAFAGDEEARAGEEALGDGLLGEEIGIVDAEIAHQRHAGAERFQHVSGGLIGADLRRVVHGLEGQFMDPVPGEVSVRLDQAGHDGLAAGVYDIKIGVAEVGRLADADDLAAADFDETILDDLVSNGGDDATLEDLIDRLSVEHGLGDLGIMPGGGFRHRTSSKRNDAAVNWEARQKARGYFDMVVVDDHGVDGAVAVAAGAVDAGFVGKDHAGLDRGHVAGRKPGGFVALKAHAVADAVADGVAEAGGFERIEGRVVDILAAGAWF